MPSDPFTPPGPAQPRPHYEAGKPLWFYTETKIGCTGPMLIENVDALRNWPEHQHVEYRGPFPLPWNAQGVEGRPKLPEGPDGLLWPDIKAMAVSYSETFGDLGVLAASLLALMELFEEPTSEAECRAAAGGTDG